MRPLFPVTSENQMDVAGHYAPCKYLHPFFSLAIMKAVDDYILVLVACKYIQPLNNSEANKVNAIGVMKLVVAAHVSI